RLAGRRHDRRRRGSEAARLRDRSGAAVRERSVRGVALGRADRACVARDREAAGSGRAVTILDAIGNTPLVRLQRCVPANGAELWLKLEYLSPSGSMKDRMALAMIERAERDGLLAPGDTVVEYTGGSTGPALALASPGEGLPRADRDGGLLQRRALPAAACARRR